jgi:hypothetical protein
MQRGVASQTVMQKSCHVHLPQQQRIIEIEEPALGNLQVSANLEREVQENT